LWQEIWLASQKPIGSQSGLIDMSEIEIRGLTKTFGNLVAVEDLSLQIPRGNIFGFLGPNGSGKSTTVKMLTGLLKPDRGDALICGSSKRCWLYSYCR